jgi:hypothetical protein
VSISCLLHISQKGTAGSRAGWQSSGLVFGRCSVLISAGVSPILREIFCGFIQSIQANAGVILD